MTAPPDYLKDKLVVSTRLGAAGLLHDGQWCGHGEPQYAVFDVQVGNENTFSLQLPDLSDENGGEFTAPVVMVQSDSGLIFPIYDPRRHPASLFYPENSLTQYTASPLQPNFQCPGCGQARFNLAVGFEIPSDSTSPNDTSWFALAAKCVECQWKDLIFDDETA